ncbi:MAG: hypothetical protein JXA22_03640 [Candidatus Thermoplasmatota archaeon]|nr:hypothetical protein [Candidatus Thermoplasmatota archaeon]
MARSKNGYRSYRSGDPIHIVVTQEFVDDANRFFSYCKDRGYNPSQIIRQAMVDWLVKEENVLTRSSEPIPPTTEFDDKIIELVREKKRTMTKMNLRSVKEILDERDGT